MAVGVGQRCVVRIQITDIELRNAKDIMATIVSPRGEEKCQEVSFDEISGLVYVVVDVNSAGAYSMWLTVRFAEEVVYTPAFVFAEVEGDAAPCDAPYIVDVEVAGESVTVTPPKIDVDAVTREEFEQLSKDVAGKVDKVEGKGLSTNDFTDEYKQKVEEFIIDKELSDVSDNAIANSAVVKGLAGLAEGVSTAIGQVSESFNAELEKKADTEGYYPNMSVGSTPTLNQLVGRGKNYFSGAYLGSSGLWEEGNHTYILLAVKGADVVKISSSWALQYALLQDTGEVKQGQTPIFCNGYNGRLSSDAPIEITCPSDCNYIYILRSYSGAVRDIEISINGIENLIDIIPSIMQAAERSSAIANSVLPISNLGDWLCKLDGNASIKFYNPIVLSKNGDSIEFTFSQIAPTTMGEGGYAFTKNAQTTNGVRGLFIAQNILSVRADDGTWLLSNTWIKNGISSVKISYINDHIEIYANGEIISTYEYPKTITFESIGDGTTNEYTARWSGVIESISYNGVVFDWLGAELIYEKATIYRSTGFLMKGQDNALPQLMAEKLANKLLLYWRCSENKYICYPLEYRYKAFVENTNPSFYDNWGIGQPYIAELDTDTMIKREPLFNPAEAELAISVANANGTNEYVGGAMHGFENINVVDGVRTILFLVNNQNVSEAGIFSLREVREIDIVQETSLFQSLTNVDKWAIATKKWHFDNNGLRISTDVEIIRDLPISVAQFGMMGVYRHWEGNANEPYLTNKAIKDNMPFKEFTIDDSGIPEELQMRDADCTKITTYGEKNFGFSLKMENTTTKDVGGMFVSNNNGTPYNKIYYQMGQHFTTSVGEHLTATQIWNIYKTE